MSILRAKVRGNQTRTHVPTVYMLFLMWMWMYHQGFHLAIYSGQERLFSIAHCIHVLSFQLCLVALHLSSLFLISEWHWLAFLTNHELIGSCLWWGDCYGGPCVTELVKNQEKFGNHNFTSPPSGGVKTNDRKVQNKFENFRLRFVEIAFGNFGPMLTKTKRNPKIYFFQSFKIKKIFLCEEL